MGRRTSHVPGAFSWVDLATPDATAAKSFYTGLFGWETEDDEARGGAGLHDVSHRRRRRLRPLREPPHWRPCFTVESMEPAVERVRELGGRVLLGPLEIYDGGVAVVQDPQGALFALFAGEVDP